MVPLFRCALRTSQALASRLYVILAIPEQGDYDAARLLAALLAVSVVAERRERRAIGMREKDS